MAFKRLQFPASCEKSDSLWARSVACCCFASIAIGRAKPTKHVRCRGECHGTNEEETDGDTWREFVFLSRWKSNLLYLWLSLLIEHLTLLSFNDVKDFRSYLSIFTLSTALTVNTTLKPFFVHNFDVHNLFPLLHAHLILSSTNAGATALSVMIGM